MLLDALRIAASQNAEQFVVRNEEEARERVALRVEIVVERLLTAFETLRQGLQIGQPVLLVTGQLDVRLLGRLGHYLHQQTRVCATPSPLPR